MSNESTASIDLAQLDKLLNVGAQMSNVMFNLAQRPGDKLTGDHVATMDSLRQKWDAARRSLTSGVPAEPAAAQYKVPGETWDECCIEEKDAMLARGYEFRYLYAAPVHGAAAPISIEGLGRMTNEDDGYLTLQFKDEDAACAFMQKYAPSVEVDEMPPMRDAAAPSCPTCKGNDQNAPCAYPSEGKPGCLRDERLAAAKTDHAPTGRALMDQWNAGAKALAELPPLPTATARMYSQNGYRRASVSAGKGAPLFAADQMRDYGLACVAIGRGAAVRDYISPSASAAGAGSDNAAIELARADCSPVPVSSQELAALHRFCDCCEDSDAGGHDVPKAMMSQLVRIGLVRPAGPGRHETTKFGDWMRDVAGAHPVQDGEKDAPVCDLPPAGWHCTRAPGHDGPCAAWPELGKPTITGDELAAFNRFCECAEDFDSGGHDVPKNMMKRLAAIGLVRSCGFGRHETTLFGDFVRNSPAAAQQDAKGERP